MYSMSTGKKIVVNNWRFAIFYDRVMRKWVQPHSEATAKAKEIMEDDNFVWKEGQKEKSIQKYLLMEAQDIDWNTFMVEAMQMSRHHENMVDTLTKAYVDYQGDNDSPKLIKTIYGILEPLKLDVIKEPKL